jgi:hypothetical protein
MNPKRLIFSPAFFVITIILLITVAIFSVTLAVFLGIGYLLSSLLPFTFFQSTIIVIGHLFLILSFISITVLHNKLNNIEILLTDDDYEEEDNEFEEDTDDDDDEWRKKVALISNLKAGQNEPCPCGSGKKFKFCCMDKK